MAGKKKTKRKQIAPKILPNKHSGRLTHHRHTSYESLLALLIVAIILVFTIGNTLVSAQSAPAVTDSTGNYAVVAAPAPSTTPEITGISEGQVFTSPGPVQIGGRCTSGTIVKIFRNQIFTGSAFCNGGSFNLQSDLFIGANSIVARAHNLNDQAGPDSAPINVRLILDGRGTANDTVNPFGGPAGQIFITAERFFGGFKPGELNKWPLNVSGGQSPYAVNIGWGDRTTDLVSRGQDGNFEISHTYEKTGTYKVVINAVDQSGKKATLELVAVSEGQQPGSAGSTDPGGSGAATWVRLSWQILAALTLVIFSFWLGEKREAHILRKRYRIA